MSKTHTSYVKPPRLTDRSSSSYRRDIGTDLPRETVGTAELNLLSGVGMAGAAQRDFPVDPRPVAATGRCARCGGATWHHQAHDICGRCGRSTQHQAPEVRLLKRSA